MGAGEVECVVANATFVNRAHVEVGQCEFEFTASAMYIRDLSVGVEFQRRGIGRAWATALESAAAPLVDEVTVWADGPGGYFWASSAFAFNEITAEEFFDLAWPRLQSTIPADHLGVLDVLEQAILAGTIRLPAEIAAFGSDHAWRVAGQKMWVGKAAVMSAPWYGIRRLRGLRH